MLKSLFRKILTKKWKVQTNSKYDYLNKSDEVRGKKASEMILVNKLNVDKVLNSPNPLYTDINRSSEAKIGGLQLISKMKNSLSNLITVSIVKDASSSPASDAVQEITFDSVPDSGSWSVTYNGVESPLMDKNSDVQSELRQIAGLADVEVTGDYSAGFQVTFAGSAGSQPQPLLVIASNTLVDISSDPVTITIVETTPGSAGSDDSGVEVSGTNITVHCDPSATVQDVADLIADYPPALALVSVAVESGKEGDAVEEVQGLPLLGGA